MIKGGAVHAAPLFLRIARDDVRAARNGGGAFRTCDVRNVGEIVLFVSQRFFILRYAARFAGGASPSPTSVRANVLFVPPLRCSGNINSKSIYDHFDQKFF